MPCSMLYKDSGGGDGGVSATDDGESRRGGPRGWRRRHGGVTVPAQALECRSYGRSIHGVGLQYGRRERHTGESEWLWRCR